MGHGVAQVTAAAGYEVLAIEAKDDALKAGMKRHDSWIAWLNVLHIIVVRVVDCSGLRTRCRRSLRAM
jgi:hypothetical protein